MSAVSGRDAHRRVTTLFSVVLMVLGVAMIVRALAGGGGPLALGVLMGVLFALAGAGRIYVSCRMGP